MPRHCFVFYLHKDVTLTQYFKKKQKNNTTTYKAVLLFLMHNVWKSFYCFNIFFLTRLTNLNPESEITQRQTCLSLLPSMIFSSSKQDIVWMQSLLDIVGKVDKTLFSVFQLFFSKFKFRIKISLFHLSLTFFSPSLIIVATLLCTFKMRDRSKLMWISAISTCWWAFSSAEISH